MKFPLKLTILSVWTKFLQKECFWSKTDNVNNTIEFFMFKFLISLCTKFELKLTLFMFWTKFAKKGCLPSKIEKLNTTIKFGISELVLVSCQQKLTMLTFLSKSGKHCASHLKGEHWTVLLNFAYLDQCRYQISD